MSLTGRGANRCRQREIDIVQMGQGFTNLSPQFPLNRHFKCQSIDFVRPQRSFCEPVRAIGVGVGYHDILWSQSGDGGTYDRSPFTDVSDNKNRYFDMAAEPMDDDG